MKSSELIALNMKPIGKYSEYPGVKKNRRKYGTISEQIVDDQLPDPVFD
jgi:hypothetical protein